MRLLLDERIPRPLKKEFVGHDGKTAKEAGLAGLKNGQLLRAAEGEFEALITVDKRSLINRTLGHFRLLFCC